MLSSKKHPTPGPVVAIVGRTNVGKSTLFNRLIEEAKALVSPVPGTTRDRNYGICNWNKNTFVVVDTGGLDVSLKDKIEAEVVRQAHLAIKEAEIILFVVDVATGPLPQDKQLAAELRKTQKPVIFATNKADNPRLRALAHAPSWRALGLGEPHAVSAENGSGTGDLLDEIVKSFSKAKDIPTPLLESPPTKIAIIGKPNVGKSSLVNALLGEERVIVSDIPHTTREPEDSLLLYNDEPYLLIDTAGIRKRARIERGLEKSGVKKSLIAAKRADVVVLVIEAGEPINIQDKHLAGVAIETGKPFVVVINKWDKIPSKTAKTINEATEDVRAALPFLNWAPVLFVSAKTVERVEKILEEAKAARAAFEREIPAHDLGMFLKNVLRAPRGLKGKGVRHPRILAIRQRGIKPPTFEIAVREREPLAPSYVRFLQRLLRENFNLVGTPIVFKSRGIRL